MNEKKTISKALRSAWKISVSEIKDLGIDPGKDWEEITYRELGLVAVHLDVQIHAIVNPRLYD